MLNNGYIHADLNEFLEFMDARADVCLFLITHGSKIDFHGTLKEGKLYEILADKKLMDTYGNCRVNGISVTLGKVNIQIEEELGDK